METHYDNLKITSKHGPFMHLLIEPESKHRFRYHSEKGFHGVLGGRERKNGKKTYPTVKLENFTGSSSDIFIKVSLCAENKTEHGMQFKEKKTSQLKSYIEVDLDKDFCAVFKNLTIVTFKIEERKKNLLERKIQSLGENLSKSAKKKFEKEYNEDALKEAKEINGSVVLKFEAFKRPNIRICSPLYSEPICQLKDAARGELKITRMSQVSGSWKGGEDVILLCEKIQKDNVKIKFFEIDEYGNKWEAYAPFSKADVHYQVAIPFKTPPYKANVEKRVAVCLERGDEISEARYFTYIPDDCPSKKRKKYMIEETFQQMPSSTDDTSSSSCSGVVPDCTLPKSEDFLQNMFARFPVRQHEAENPPTDSSQKDLECPSTLLGPDFQNSFTLDLFNQLISSDGIDPINDQIDMQIPEEYIYSSNLSGFDLIDHLTQADGGTAIDFGRPIRRPAGQMLWKGQMDDAKSKTHMDFKKLVGQVAEMGIEDSEDKFLKKKPEKELKNKIPEDQHSKLKQYLLFINYKDKDGNTFLHLAVLHNKNIKQILELIKKLNSDLINAQNNNKQTALHIAIEKNSTAVKELLQNSANPSIKNAKGDNCCHIACQRNLDNCLRYILDPRCCHALILHDCNYEGLTPVHVALKYNSLYCLDFLFSKCYYLMDFSAIDSKLNQTFLHYAVEYSPSYVSHLLKESEIAVNYRDSNGNTPLHIACAKGNYEVVKELMEAGADPGIRNFKHNGSISDEEDSEDEAWMGQTPADLTEDSKILNLLKSEDSCLWDSDKDEESARIFDELSKNLSILLNPDMRWKELAMYFLDEKYVTSLVKCSQNPTRTILEYMKKNFGKLYTEQLITVFDMIGFLDAGKVTKESCQHQNII